jgi:hypothetical protein
MVPVKSLAGRRYIRMRTEGVSPSMHWAADILSLSMIFFGDAAEECGAH